MLLAHLSILISVFFLMLAIINWIPSAFNTYRERYQLSVRRTTRELDKFFINIKPTYILIGAAILGACLGVLSGSWVIAVAVLATGIFAPRMMLSVWKEIRSTQFERS